MNRIFKGIAVAMLSLQRGNGRLKTPIIIEHSRDSVSDQIGGNHGQQACSWLGGRRRTLLEGSRTENETNPSDVTNHGGLIWCVDLATQFAHMNIDKVRFRDELIVPNILEEGCPR